MTTNIQGNTGVYWNIRQIEEQEALELRDETRVGQRIRKLENENQTLQNRVNDLTNDNCDTDGRIKQQNANAAIISMVFLILSVGLLLAGIFTAAFAALPLVAFLPMITFGAIGTIALPIIFEKACKVQLYR